MKSDEAVAEYRLKCQRARMRFEACGVTIAEWATSRGYSPELVYAVLAGRISGKRGKAHQIAVELRLKQDPRLTCPSDLQEFGRLSPSMTSSIRIAEVNPM